MKTKDAVPNGLKFVYPDIRPEQYWLMCDEWLMSLGGYDNSTWDEIAPWYAARTPPSRAAAAVMRGRLVTP